MSSQKNDPRTAEVSENEKERFWAKVEQGDPEECWHWQAGKDKNGYGVFKLKGKKWRAHRVSVLVDGRDPAGRVVMHTCDNPGCVNPNHLKLGTH